MAHTVYKVNEKKVPSVTTILSRFKNAIGLIIWSNKLGLEGKNYHTELNKAGDFVNSLISKSSDCSLPNLAKINLLMSTPSCSLIM